MTLTCDQGLSSLTRLAGDFCHALQCFSVSVSDMQLSIAVRGRGAVPEIHWERVDCRGQVRPTQVQLRGVPGPARGPGGPAGAGVPPLLRQAQGTGIHFQISKLAMAKIKGVDQWAITG